MASPLGFFSRLTLRYFIRHGATCAVSLGALACGGDPALTAQLDDTQESAEPPKPDAPDSDPEAGGDCSAVRGQLIGEVDSVSVGQVELESAANPRTLYVDASAGGFQGAASNPYLYVNLTHGTQVSVTDLEADTSVDWDLAFKRFTIRTNGGDSGPGHGGAVGYVTDFDDLTQNSVDPSDIERDNFFDDETCEPLDSGSGVGSIATAFGSWYLYDEDTMVLTPAPATYVVQGADGVTLYKLQILDYYASPDGGTGTASGRFRLVYEAL